MFAARTRFAVDLRRAAVLAHPDHQRFVEQTSFVQIIQQRWIRQIESGQQ
jgi:hypothetical protein